MKMLAAFLLLLAPLFTSSAHAQVERVVGDQLFLIGAGIYHPGFPVNLALACVAGVTQSSDDANRCTSVRFVAFNEKKEAYYVGEAHDIRQLKDAQEFAGELAKKPRMSSDTRGLIGYFGMVGGAAGSLLWSVSIASVVPFAIVWGAVGIPTIVILMVSKKGHEMDGVRSYFSGIGTGMTAPFVIDASNDSSRVSTATLSTDGWNWSSNPVKVSKKILKRMINALDSTALKTLAP